MLRLETADGWWLITHPDHAHLAGEFASQWGNELFVTPEPRGHVLCGIYKHDDGWRERDREPVVTKLGKPAAFSTELVGKYSAFEEIDLAGYLAVRREAVQLVAQEDPYAAILISMHTHNLLSARADRSTIREDQLPLLDMFLVEQLTLQRRLRERLLLNGGVAAEHLTMDALHRHFQMLQACDNLSLLSCVDFEGEASLLHPFTLRDGRTSEVKVEHIGERSFRLTPYPLAERKVVFKLQARYVPDKYFASNDELKATLDVAKYEQLDVTITA